MGATRSLAPHELFRESFRNLQLDPLVINESGQCALVHATVCSLAHQRVPLLCDLQQLPHISQAARFDGIERSVRNIYAASSSCGLSPTPTLGFAYRVDFSHGGVLRSLGFHDSPAHRGRPGK